MSKKKESWMRQIPEPIWFLFLLVIFGILASLSNTSFVFCDSNPDQCVCEEWKCSDKTGLAGKNPKYFKDEIEKSCSQFRKKTQAELDVDSCNNNPREDEECRCEKWDIKSGRVYYKQDYENVTARSFICNAPFCVFNVDDGDMIFLKKDEYFNSPCIKSRPKNECEKGNEDWVEEKRLSDEDYVINNLFRSIIFFIKL